VSDRRKNDAGYWQATMQAVVAIVKTVGADAALYLIMALGTFAALLKGVDPCWLSWIDIIIVGGWIANKFADAKIGERRAANDASSLRQGQGRALMEKHQDKRRKAPQTKKRR